MPLTQCEACHHAPLECRIDSDEPEQLLNVNHFYQWRAS
jgi:hypothetical protein